MICLIVDQSNEHGRLKLTARCGRVDWRKSTEPAPATFTMWASDTTCQDCQP